MSECIFCRIAAAEVSADVVYASETTVVFRDLAPQAPVHLLVIPREHHESAAEMAALDALGFSDLFLAVAEVTRETGLDAAGYRVATNVGEHAGQEVAHLHLHVLGGERLRSLGRARA
ncbi:MAG: histidine triad nucleotide-binding protein [Ornithinimicrobium sp.]